MQINVALDSQNKTQAQQLRARWYSGNTTATQIRDSFIYQQCIDNFNDDIKMLLPYIKNESQGTTQRRLSIKSSSYERLKTIAAALNASLAASYRAIIAYSVDHVKDSADNVTVNNFYTENSQLLTVKISLLETQLMACNKTLAEIKALVEVEQNDLAGTL